MSEKAFEPEANALLRENGPLYRQLASILRRPIETGDAPVGAMLPKEAEIAGRFGISLITVRHALRELEADGLIRKRAAKPAVVVARVPPARLSWNFKNFGDIARYTKNARLDVASYRREKAGIAAEKFGLRAADTCYCLRGVLQVQGRPETQVVAYFPPAIGRRLKRASFDNALIFQSVQRHLGIQLAAANINVRAELADAKLARQLEYEEGGAILTMEMLYRSVDQQPVEFTIARHRADVFSLTYEAPNDIG